MRKQQRLDFLRRDILAAANDDILLAVGDEQIALGIEPADVAGAVPAARQEGARIERGVEITEKKLRPARADLAVGTGRSEEHTSELQSLMRISYAVFCLKKKKKQSITEHTTYNTHLKEHR